MVTDTVTNCRLIMNLLQCLLYVSPREKLAFVFLTYFICVFRRLLSINSKYIPIQYSLIAFLMEERCILGEENVTIIAGRNQKLQCPVIP